MHLRINLFFLLFIILLPGNPDHVFAGMPLRIRSAGAVPLLLGTRVTQGLPIGEATSSSYQMSVPEYGTGDIAPHGAPDGIVDVADAMLAMRIVTGQVTPTQLDLARGDVAPLSTPDGTMDIADALLIMRKAIGLVSF